MNRSSSSQGRWLVLLGLCTWCLLSPGFLWAQNYCNLPGTQTGGFQLNRTRVCANSGISLVLTNTTAGLKNIQYIVGYTGTSLTTPTPIPDLTGTTSVTAPVSNSPGTYTVLQIGAGGPANDPYTKCETITVLPNDALDFTAQSCDNRQVTLNFQFTPTNELYDEAEVDWGNGIKQSYLLKDLKAGLASYRYPAGADNYTIKVRGVYKDIPDCSALVRQQDVKLINGTIAQPFISQMTTFGDGTVLMRIQGPDNVDFEVLHKQADGSYKSFFQNQRNGSAPIANVDSRTVPQCFQVRLATGCAVAAANEDYCSLVLTAKAEPGQNSLNWNPYTGPSSTLIWRLQRNGTPISIPGNINKNTRSYIDDQNIGCNTQYCYRLSAEAGRTTYTSNVVCVTGISNNQPNALSNVVVSVQNNGQVSIRTIDPNPSGVGVYTIVVTRANGPGGTFTEVGQVANRPLYDDLSARTADQSYCYQLLLRNECGQETLPSLPACTIWLTSKSPRALDWTADSPFGSKSVNRYELEITDKSTGTVIATIPLGANTHLDFDPEDKYLSNQYRYRIVAIATDGTVSYSNGYELQVEAGIFAPTAFTPNGNGANDRFQVFGSFTDDFRLTIFNRWGAVVYSTTSAKPEDGWDGTADGQPAPVGPYTWRAEVRDKTGKQTVKISSVLLIR